MPPSGRTSPGTPVRTGWTEPRVCGIAVSRRTYSVAAEKVRPGQATASDPERLRGVPGVQHLVQVHQQNVEPGRLDRGARPELVPDLVTEVRHGRPELRLVHVQRNGVVDDGGPKTHGGRTTGTDVDGDLGEVHPQAAHQLVDERRLH